MPRFSANLSMMFGESDFLDRFNNVREAGFGAVEFLFPYAYEADVIGNKLRENSRAVSVFNFPPGNWEAGERGCAALAGRASEFRSSVEMALKYAKAAGAQRLHAMAGITAGLDQQQAQDIYGENLAYAAKALADEGLELLIEPINSRDMPGYFLSSTDQAAGIIEQVGAPNLKLLFDVYHHQIIRGDVLRSLERLMPMIGHVQIAGVPARHEPDAGELNYRAVFAKLDELGYAGWVGCEYRPCGTTLAGLKWLRDLQPDS